MNHKYIVSFVSLMYGIDVTTFADVFGTSLSRKQLQSSTVLQRFKSENLQEKLKAIFRTSDIQKLRGAIVNVRDLVTVLRAISRYYRLDWQSYYAADDTVYVISNKK